MPELTRHSLAKILGEATIRTRIYSGEALTKTAQVIETQAKINASAGSHRPATPTPARPGGGPAVVSGDLRRSIMHTELREGSEGPEIRIGPASVAHRTYGRSRGGTTSGKIGLYLETGLRNGAKYPFLLPAFHWGVRRAYVSYKERFDAGPWRVDV